MIEVWEKIPGWEYYEASSLGRIKALKKPIFNGSGWRWSKEFLPKITPNADGYNCVWLNDGDGKKANKLVGRLICETFHGTPEPGWECNHKNFDRSDDSKDNVEWLTHKDNVEHSRAVGNYKSNGRR